MKMTDSVLGVSPVLVSNNPSVSIATTMSSLMSGGALNLNNCAAALANMNNMNSQNQSQQLMLMNSSPVGVTCVSQSSLSNSNSPNSSSSNNQNTQHLADYLAQLIKDKKQLAIFPNLFLHVERILDEEINRVRGNLFHLSGTKQEPLDLPEPNGPVSTMSEKVYVPVKDHPDFNFVGRILGPRGMTAKQLEQETGCKIMIRGKGSMRDKKKEEQNRGKPNWEHLNDELHVLITVEDTENRGKLKLQRAVDEVNKLLIPSEGEDELKKRQLMELAIINGTYRDSKETRNSVAANAAQMVSPQVPLSHHLRAATPLGAPLIISPHHRLSNGLSQGGGGGAPLLTQATADSLLYASPYTTADYATYLSLAEYPPDHGSKETAFIYAVTSAGVVHSITQSCSSGVLNECSCDLTKQGRTTPEGWKWGGCSDNLKFGVQFSRRFVDAPEKSKSYSSKSVRSLMNLHNNEAGRQAISQLMRMQCRCHGVSGSCELKTCWKNVPSFNEVGDFLKKKYSKSVQVALKSRKRLRRKTGRKFSVSKGELVHLRKSPDYCSYDPEKGILGTSGRVCNKTSTGPDRCSGAAMSSAKYAKPKEVNMFASNK